MLIFADFSTHALAFVARKSAALFSICAYDFSLTCASRGLHRLYCAVHSYIYILHRLWEIDIVMSWWKCRMIIYSNRETKHQFWIGFSISPRIARTLSTSRSLARSEDRWRIGAFLFSSSVLGAHRTYIAVRKLPCRSLTWTTHAITAIVIYTNICV